MNRIKEGFSILAGRRKLPYFIIFLVFLIIFSNAFFSGQYLFKNDEAMARQILEQVKGIEKLKVLDGMMDEGNYALVSLLIFFNNFLIDAFSVYTGILFIFTVFIPLSNVLLLGVLIGIQSMMPDSFSLLRLSLLIIVAGLEFFCMILSSYEGLRIGLSMFNPKAFGKKKRKDSLKQAYKEASKVLLIIALILIIAAIIETAGIAFLKVQSI